MRTFYRYSPFPPPPTRVVLASFVFAGLAALASIALVVWSIAFSDHLSGDTSKVIRYGDRAEAQAANRANF